MEYEFSVYELSKVLRELDSKCDLDIVIKNTLAGGWVTINGKLKVVRQAMESVGCHKRDLNILRLKISNGDSEGILVNLTGAKGKKFRVSLEKSIYRQFTIGCAPGGKLREAENECKLKIDNDIVIKINCSDEEVKGIIGGTSTNYDR